MTLDSIRTIDTMTEPQAWPIESVTPLDHGYYRVTLKGSGTLIHDERELAAAGITPPPDPINIPTEMVAAFKEAWHKADGEGRPGRRVEEGLRAALRVHVPDAPSVRTALHTIGLTDQEIANIVNDYWPSLVIDKIRDAAKAAENER